MIFQDDGSVDVRTVGLNLGSLWPVHGSGRGRLKIGPRICPQVHDIGPDDASSFIRRTTMA